MDQSPAGPDTLAGEKAQEGEDTSPATAYRDLQESAGSGLNNNGSEDILQPASERTENVVPEAEEPGAPATASREPGTATADDAFGETAAGGHSEDGRPPDTVNITASQQGTGADSAAAAEPTESATSEASVPTPETVEGHDADSGMEGAAGGDTVQPEGGDTSGSGDHTSPTEKGSAGEITDAAGAEDESGSGQSSARESGSDGSGGRSLTRLVERSSLEQQHRALLLLRRQLLARNQRVQQRLSQHFSRKTDDTGERVEKNVGELEARYSRYLSGIREQQRFTAEERQRRQQELAAFRAQVERQTEMVTAAYDTAVELRRQVALKSRSSRTGRLMAAAEVEALISREQQKEMEVQEARLESLRRETRLSRLEQTLRESEELAGGIHLIDFEQLKIENQTYAEKIEERNEDLTKLRRKISSTVQILTHLKERIQFEQAENERRQFQLQTVSADVTHGRESLAQLKQRRDQVRSRTASQRAAAGLLGHEPLLRDFEARVDEEVRLVRELSCLKREYADQQRMTQAIRQAVRARRQQQQHGKPRMVDRH